MLDAFLAVGWQVIMFLFGVTVGLLTAKWSKGDD